MFFHVKYIARVFFKPYGLCLLIGELNIYFVINIFEYISVMYF